MRVRGQLSVVDSLSTSEFWRTEPRSFGLASTRYKPSCQTGYSSFNPGSKVMEGYEMELQIPEKKEAQFSAAAPQPG